MTPLASHFRSTASAFALAAGFMASDAKAQTYAAEPEYTVNYSLGAINAAAAFTAGYTGLGVTVAVLDSGINRSNPDLSASGKVLAGYDYVDNTSSVTYDTLGHG